MSDNIPFEIQQEIIKKVSDVKSLLRFRSVSNPWKAFIDSSDFIAGYGTCNTQPHRLLFRYTDNLDEVRYVSFVDDVTFPQQQLDFSPYVPDLVKQLNRSTVIGNSCGLWCLHGYNNSETEMVVIWNPSIRKSIGILLPHFLSSSPRFDITIGFGVCPSTYDPTIVNISYSYTPLKGKDKWQVEIFTLSSKTWKTISSSNLPRESTRIRSFTQVAIDRFIYWYAYDNVLNYKHLILSFDLITHDFKEVNLDVSITNQFASDISISKLNESLVVSAVVAAITDELNDIVYGIWVMGEEGGGTTSFTKLFNIKTPILISEVLGFTSNGEAILETQKVTEEFAIVKVYKPCSQHINEIGMNGEAGSFSIYPYTETLLLLDHSD